MSMSMSSSFRDIRGGFQIYIMGPCALRTPPSGKILTPQVLAYTIITKVLAS